MIYETDFTDVRYCETDQMGFVHHSNYVKFFEMARIEWLNSVGVSYADMEKNGILMPVAEVQLQFLKPLLFGDRFKIIVSSEKPPTATITFTYSLFNENEDKICTGSTRLAFLNATTKRPIRCPDNLKDLFRAS